MLFLGRKKKRIEKAFMEEVSAYASNIPAQKERVGELSFQFEKKLMSIKSEAEALLEKMKKEEDKEYFRWLILTMEEYISMSKYAKKSLLGNEKSRKKVEKHQKNALQYFQKLSKK